MNRTLAALIFIFIVVVFSGACKGKAPAPKAAPAQPAQAAASKEIEAKGPQTEEEVFIYDRKGKRDPFSSPTVTVQEISPGKCEIPLECYDVVSIKILGIVWNNGGHYAEVVLPDGKAYTLREGMTIGLHKGTVQKITRGSILIKENIKDYKGAIKPKETILKLREEEEE